MSIVKGYIADRCNWLFRKSRGHGEEHYAVDEELINKLEELDLRIQEIIASTLSASDNPKMFELRRWYLEHRS